MNLRKLWLILFDVLFVLMGFWLSAFLKHSVFSSYFISYYYGLILFGIIWILLSLLFGKFNIKPNSRNTKRILISNLSILALSSFLIYVLRDDKYSRFIVIGTIGFTTVMELFFFTFLHSVKNTRILSEDLLLAEEKPKIVERLIETTEPIIIDQKRVQSIQKEILHELGKTAYCYFEKAVKLFSETTLILSTTTRFNVLNQRDNYYRAIINLKRVNDIRRINKFFEAVNEKLPQGGVFVCLAETTELRKKRILSKYPPVLNNIYYILDYFLKRVFPKFPITKNIYFMLTRGENRVISKAELLGRLYSCGFEVVEEEHVENLFYVVAHKIKHPAFDLEPTYGPIIKLRRIGRGGKTIKVYKIRTMHPYAEYLQGYVFEKHSLEQGGKFKNDFRVSTLGRFMRKFWIDELPMLINLFRGDLKIVGVRPLSQHYFNLYSKELQEKRTKFKPGLVPPFYVDNPKTLEEIMASEMKYLEAYEKHPFRTDIKYFFNAFYNIIFKRLRSK